MTDADGAKIFPEAPEIEFIRDPAGEERSSKDLHRQYWMTLIESATT